MRNILVYLTNILNFNAYSFDIQKNRLEVIASTFDFDFSNASHFAEQAKKNTYSLIKTSDFFTIGILVSPTQLILLIPNFTIFNYVEKDLNLLFILSRLKLLCQLVYEVISNTTAPEDEVYIGGLQSESIEYIDESMYQETLSLNELNIKLLHAILSHDRNQFLFWKSKLLKNKVLISELTNVYSKNTLIEYIALLSNLVINYGYPCQDVYAIKKKIYATIEQSNFDPINIEILNQIICLFFDLLLNETYSSEIEGFQKIKYHIDRNITQSLTLSDIARNLHMPLKELNPLFKSKYNITINQYIRRKKIDISKSLLYATNLSFQDIATFVGFNSQSYFITTFKAIVGQTPSDYRKCNKKQNLV